MFLLRNSINGEYKNQIQQFLIFSTGFSQNVERLLACRELTLLYRLYVPHWPLQAPLDLITKYKGLYDDGSTVLREKRLDIQRQLGFVIT
jgi:hypothetical protein